MPLTGNFRVKSTYITIFVLLLTSYFLIFYTSQVFLKQSRWVEHSDFVINNLEKLLSHVNEAESGARGYVILNDKDHLETFNSSTKKIDSLLKTIDSLIADNSLQQKHADTLRLLVQEKLGMMKSGILLFKQAGNVITSEMKARGETGKKLTNNIKFMIQLMESEETNLLLSRKEDLQKVFVSIKIITITSLIIALLLFGYSYFTYLRESKGKLKASVQADSYRDQLEKKVAELQEANKELEELRSQEKFTTTGRIARTIAHEIRNPLTNIGLASEQLKADIDQNEEAVMLLDMINRNAFRINQMISELLTSTRFAQLQHLKVDISSLLDETLELAHDRIELKQVAIKKNYLPGKHELMIDMDKMKIAFLNVIVNAIESMEKGTGVLEMSVRTENDKCIIDFKDNGMGMNEETLQRVFDPYFTTKNKGAGLGLTNTQNIILNHKGNIYVTSEPGEGTIFSIILPVN